MTMKHFTGRAAMLGALVASAFAANQAVAQQQEPRVFGETAARGNGIGLHTPNLDVALYGLLDVTLSTANNIDAVGHRRTNFQKPWFSGPRWGVIGSRALPDGAPNLIFKLEGEYLLDTGEEDTPGVLFNRDAWVGFQGETMGKLTFGRQNTLARDFSHIYGDPYTASGQVTLDEGGWTNTNNFKQLINYAASATGTRYDRGVVWKKQFGAFVAGAGYQFASDPSTTPSTAGRGGKNSTQSAALAWNGGVFNASGFVNHANIQGFSHKSWSLGGNAGLGSMTRVYAGYFHYDAEQAAIGSRTDKAWTASLRFAPPGKLDYEAGFVNIKADNGGLSSKGFILDGYKDTSGVTTGVTGKKTTLYGSIFYHFDRSTEVYLAADHMSLKEGWKDPRSFGANSQNEIAVGIRTRF
jgi:predicted porin